MVSLHEMQKLIIVPLFSPNATDLPTGADESLYCRAGEPRAKLDRMAPSIDSTIRSAGSGAGVEAERAWNVLNIDQ